MSYRHNPEDLQTLVVRMERAGWIAPKGASVNMDNFGLLLTTKGQERLGRYAEISRGWMADTLSAAGPKVSLVEFAAMMASCHDASHELGTPELSPGEEEAMMAVVLGFAARNGLLNSGPSETQQN